MSRIEPALNALSAASVLLGGGQRLPSASSILAGAGVNGDTYDRIDITAGNGIAFGSGAAALDTFLQRGGIGTLSTPGQFNTSLDIYSRVGNATQLLIGNAGPLGQSGISFQSGEAGSNLYRAAPGALQIDGNFRAKTFQVGPSGAAGGYMQLASTGAGAVDQSVSYSMGTGAPNNANGANGDIYINAAGGALTTMYQRRLGAWVGIV